MTDERESTLSYAVRPRVILRYVGELAFVFALATLLPVLASLLFGEFRLTPPYAATSLALLGLGMLGRRQPTPHSVQRNEALTVTALAFLLSSAAMTLPFAAQGLPLLDAFFEAVSGITTTGLSTLSTLEGTPRTFLLARAWLQWVGGLGFVVLSLALLFEPGTAARGLGAPLPEEDLVTGTRQHARRVFVVYLAMTAFGALLLAALGAGPFDALVHVLAAVSTGGFAPRDESLAGLEGWALRSAVLGVCLLGAISLPLYQRVARSGPRALVGDLELRTLLLLIGVALPLLLVLGRGADGPDPLLPHALLIAISAQTTAGFSTFDPGELATAAKALVILSMLIGGSQASTAGGIKLIRLLVSVRMIGWTLVRDRLAPHAVADPRLGGRRLDFVDVQRALVVIGLFLGALFFSWLAFLAFGYDPLDSLFEVASALGTVGLSTAIARPDLEPGLKLVLCADMLLGRLEILALLTALSPRTWIGRRRP